eukprot:8688264-Pyramimonas_sp.AAC.1
MLRLATLREFVAPVTSDTSSNRSLLRLSGPMVNQGSARTCGLLCAVQRYSLCYADDDYVLPFDMVKCSGMEWVSCAVCGNTVGAAM